MNPIEAAVMPLKDEAISRAEKFARQIVKEVREELAANENDLHKVVPYPSGIGIGRLEYMAAMMKVHLFNKLTTWRDGQIVRPNGPCFADVDSKLVKKFVARAREDAAVQYDRFVAKLNKKIGPALTARLEGNHVWAYSFLYVSTTTGAQCWKTQMIVNRSKLGLVFNQFPTRKLKNAEAL